MLIQLSVENYLSIKDKVVLSLLASRDSEHQNTSFGAKIKII